MKGAVGPGGQPETLRGTGAGLGTTGGMPPTRAQTAPTPRAALRDATRVHHERVEAAVDLPARTRDRDTYRALLASLLGLFRPLERQLAALPWREAGLDLGAHRRAALLRADVADLGGDPDAVPDAPVPATPALADGFGALYVLEGSALGGQILAREAEAALELGGVGTRFFRGDGRATGAGWRAFGRALDGYLVTPERLGRARQTAEATFDAFEQAVLAPRLR